MSSKSVTGKTVLSHVLAFFGGVPYEHELQHEGLQPIDVLQLLDCQVFLRTIAFASMFGHILLHYATIAF